MDKIETQLEDIAGIRLICQFTEDIYTVAGLIRERSDMQMTEQHCLRTVWAFIWQQEKPG